MSDKLLIPRDEMEEVRFSPDVVRDRIVKHSRWTVHHELIFRRDGKLYRALYDDPATEAQEGSYYGFATDPVVCVEVREVPAVDYEDAP